MGLEQHLGIYGALRTSIGIYHGQLEEAKHLVTDAYKRHGIEPVLNTTLLEPNLYDYFRCLREFSRIVVEGQKRRQD
jgi:hypothetical protein